MADPRKHAIPAAPDRPVSTTLDLLRQSSAVFSDGPPLVSLAAFSFADSSCIYLVLFSLSLFTLCMSNIPIVIAIAIAV